ncbi:leukocyte-associated immunoglobulin-like receptor 1 isoform X2 [Orcinus orca]|uniref:leukocyte-associated immunoglobulin-like receptor 1 isoform X2 n=1 Tax=Orcinus orca TaxID=9733 RepID=UPI0014419308|nr:leukocyte-associated immunoglobulin-like receptor 1 isoform X2 [Orcinus orca]
MSPRPTTLLGLVLCLGHTMHTQAGTLPSRSTRAEPDSVSPQGWPVTIVCRGPAGAEEFRLERKEDRNDFKDEKTVFQIGPHQTEARFSITAVSRDAAQHYQCLYRKDQASDPDPPHSSETQTHPQDNDRPDGRGGRRSTSPACRQSIFIFSLGSLWPFSFVSFSWAFSSSIVGTRENGGPQEAKVRSRGPRRGSAPLLTSQMRHQIWPLSTDFLRRVGKWTPHFLGQELGIGSAGRWWLMVCPDVAVKMPTRAAFIGGSTEAGRSISTMAQSPGCGEEPHFPTTRAPPWRPASPSRRDPKEGGTEGTLSSVASPTGGPHSVIFCWSHRPTLLLCGRGLHNGD